MNRGRNIAIWFIVALLVVAVCRFWMQGQTPKLGGVPIAGGDAGGLPRADASTEGFDATPFQAAVEWAGKQRAGALLVSRHGHLLIEHYSSGANVDTLIAGGGMSDAVVLLSAGTAVPQLDRSLPASEAVDATPLAAAIAKASGRSFPQFLSRNVWQPLNAAPARWSEAEVSARAIDWLRVAELLLHDGRFEGTQVVPAGWAARVPLQRTAPGAEPFADKDMRYLRGRGATRLWLSPRFDLAILSVAGAVQSADETRLPNMIVRALRERPGVSGTSLNDLVPGH
jgi:hypothetical protein